MNPIEWLDETPRLLSTEEVQGLAMALLNGAEGSKVHSAHIARLIRKAE